MTKSPYKRVADQICANNPDAELIAAGIRELGFEDRHSAGAALVRLARLWKKPARFKKLLPSMLHLLSNSASADRSLINLENLFAYSDDRQDLLATLSDSQRTLEMLITLFAGSQFLTDIVLRQPHYVRQLADLQALTLLKNRDGFYREALQSLQGIEDLPEQLDGLRRYQRLQLWRIGTSDLCNLFNLQTVTAQLTSLARGLIQASLDVVSSACGIPGEGFVVLALGKLGGRELNYSSDVDLLFLSDDREEDFSRLGRKLIEALNKFTGEGFLYRIDMRLRPWGSTGKLVPTLQENLDYLASSARIWEKQAMLKLRVVAGDRKLGDRFYQATRSMIFGLPVEELRRSVLGMKQRIEKKLNSRGREEGEVKSGKGSIRDIEFTVQFLQLVNGEERADIRSRNTLDAMARLAANRILSMEEYRVLSEGYVFLRTVEHYLQIMHYRQTHQLPEDMRELSFLARRLGFENDERGENFFRRQQQHRSAIREIYDRLVAGHVSGTESQTSAKRAIAAGPPAMPQIDREEHAALTAALSDTQLIKVAAEALPNNCWRVTIVGYDYPGELSLICGLLSGYGLNIIDGQILTYEELQSSPPALRPRGRRRTMVKLTTSRRRKIVDIFTVVPMVAESGPPDWEAYERELVELLGLLSKREANVTHSKLAKKLAGVLTHHRVPEEAQLPANIDIDNGVSEKHTVLRIDAPDTFGFLYELTNALTLTGLNISRMKITSLGKRVHDTLYVTGMQHEKIVDPQKRDQIRAVTALVKHFTHLLPRSPNPAAAMLHFREFITQFLSQPNWMDELASLEQPGVFDALVNLLGASDFLWNDFLRMQHDNLFPVVRDVAGLIRLKSIEELRAELSGQLDGAGGITDKRALLNDFKDREMFRIDMRYIERHITEFWQFSEEITDLTEVVLQAGLDLSLGELSRQFGEPMRNDGTRACACMVALGKCGGREMGFASDIELMLLYEGDGQTSGPKSLSTMEFYDRIVYEIKQTINARREGIFEIDLRLRPYGSAGRMAVPLHEFSAYFSPHGTAWNYERQALVKMRPIWEDNPEAAFASRVISARDACVYVRGAFDTAAMRAIREKQIRQLVAGGSLNAKYSPGGLVDLEYVVQGLQMLHGEQIEALRHPNTGKAMKRLSTHGILGKEQYARFKSAHVFLRRLIDALRMVRGNAKDLTVPAPGSDAFVFLARRMGYEENPAALREELLEHTAWLRETGTALLKE